MCFLFNRRLLVTLTSAGALVLGEPSALGETLHTERDLQTLHEQAVDAYSNLDMEQASQTLEQAIAIARREGVQGDLLAQLHVTYGTVLVLGLGRLADGREQLMEAARLSRSIAPDPMLSTPLLEELWADVLADIQRAGGRGGSAEGPSSAPDDSSEVERTSTVTIRYRPVVEQLRGRAIPIYVEVPDGIGDGRILLAYRAPRMSTFLTIDMDTLTEGFAARIPCHRVQPPQVQYFISVLDRRGVERGHLGTEREPLFVSVVDQLRGPAPRLPGMDPEPPCVDGSLPEEPRTDSRRLAPRIMYFELGIGTGSGLPIAGDITRTCQEGTEIHEDQIRIKTAFSWTELVVTPGIGFFLARSVSLGVRARLQIPGALYPHVPFSWALLGQLRWYFLQRPKLRLYAMLGGGYGNTTYNIRVTGEPQCEDRYDFRAGPGIAQLGLGLLVDLHRNFGLGIEPSFSSYFPTLSLHADFLFTIHTSF